MAARRKTAQAPARANAALIDVPIETGGFDYESENNMNAPEGSENHIGDLGTRTLPVMQQGYMTTEQHAALLNRRWEDRVRREGKKVFVCPHCDHSTRVDFPTRDQAEKHIKAEHKMVLEEIKLTKGKTAHKLALQAREEIRSPKRRLEDFVSPQHAAMLAKQQAANANLIPIQDLAARTARKTITPGSLSALPEQIALTRVKDLDDRDLFEALRIADARSKRDLVRAIRAHMQTRGINQNPGMPFVQEGDLAPGQILGPDGSPVGVSTPPKARRKATSRKVAKKTTQTRAKAKAVRKRA